MLFSLLNQCVGASATHSPVLEVIYFINLCQVEVNKSADETGYILSIFLPHTACHEMARS